MLTSYITAVAVLAAVLPTTHAAAVAPRTTTVTPVPLVGAFVHVGCYTDDVSNRALASAAYMAQPNMTVEYCAQLCSGYSIFGVEWGECFRSCS